MRKPIKEKNLKQGQLVYTTEHSNCLLEYIGTDELSVLFKHISGPLHYLELDGVVYFNINPEEEYYLPEPGGYGIRRLNNEDMKEKLIEFYREWVLTTLNDTDFAEYHNLTVKELHQLLDIGLKFQSKLVE